MRNKTVFFINLIGLSVFLSGCGQIMKGEKGNVQNLLEKAVKNITTAESISDIKRKNDLLKTAESQLNEAGAVNQKDPVIQNKIASGYAYFYYASGDYGQAKKYAEKSQDQNDPFIAVLNVRINIKEKGKEYARTAAGIIELISARYPRMAMARLTLGDCHFLIGNFQDAQKYYTEVLKIGEAFQVQAADRLEILDQIRRTGIDTAKVQNIIFSFSLRRDEIADLLQRVFNAGNYLKFGKPRENNFKDISGSIYADSIRILGEKGFYTYINGEKFEPYKPVTRGEMARIIEDFIVLKSGNTALRTRFLNDAKSSIKGIDVKDPYYNAIKTAVDAKTMDISLDGSINPLEPVSGLETLNTLGKLIK